MLETRLPAATATESVAVPPAGRPPGWLFLLGVAIPPLLLDLAFGLRNLPALRQGKLLDPDSYMRLVRLRDMFAAGHPLEVVARDASGAGFVLHWSHFIDLLLCVIAAPLAIFLPWQQAILVAADAMGPLQVVALAVAVAWAASPFADRGLLWVAPVLAVLPPATISYALPGVAHHHVLALTIVVVVAGLTVRALMPAEGRTGWKIGLWSGLGIWLTPEITPLIFAAFALLYVGWLTAAQARSLAVELRDAGLAFLVAVAGLLAADPPAGGYLAADMDRISLLFLGVAGVAAAVGSCLPSIGHRWPGFTAKLLASGFLGSAAVGIWLLSFHDTLFGPRVLADLPALDAMHEVIIEMQPVTTIGAALAYLFTSVAGVIILTLYVVRVRSAVLVFGWVLSLVLLFEAQQHVRFSCYPATLGAVMLTILLSRLNQPSLAWPEAAKAALRLVAFAAFAVPPMLGNMLLQAPTAGLGPSCDVSRLAPMLAPFDGKVVLTDVDVVPELLYRTGIDTVGSLYLRNAANFVRLRDLWRASPSPAEPPGFVAARIDGILFCKHGSSARLVAGRGGDTLFDRLARDEPPAWVRQVAADPASGNVLYKVIH
jgi:hypothetical protein